jgi:chromosome segregation ATPase
MKRKENADVIKAFHRLTEAAETYVNRAPRVKRIQEQRSALLDAIADAQLVLSVHQLPKELPSERSSPKDNKTPKLEFEVKALRQALNALDKNLRPVATELESLQQRAGKARMLLDTALTKHRSEDNDEAAA